MIAALSIRARLAIAFAAALLVVLVLAAAFVLVRVHTDLRESTDEALASRLEALAAGGTHLQPAAPGDAEDNFSEVLTPTGRTLGSTLAGAAPALTPAEAATAARGELLIEARPIAGVDASARILAGPGQIGGRDVVLVAGTSNQDRSETDDRILAAFLIGAPLALLAAAGLGYLLARRALRPVERMRQQAGTVEAGSGELLELPAADDELRALAVTLNEMLERLDAALGRERQLVADASHELRTPLAVLKAELELAVIEQHDAEQLRETVQAALAEVERLNRLSDDLLVIAQADRGRIPIRRELVTPAELIERVSARFEPLAARAGRALRITTAPAEPIWIDPLRAEQALGNLIDNALAYGAGTVSIAATIEGEDLQLTVDDEGEGFSPEIRERAFERFSRASAGRVEGGAGLGLPIVLAIARSHGGDATLDPSRGAAVRVRFGSVKAPAAAPAPEAGV